MPQDRTIKARTRQTGPAGDPEEGAAAGSPLLEQAQGFAQAARDAMNDCQRGEEAVREMQRRRNRSGQ